MKRLRRWNQNLKSVYKNLTAKTISNINLKQFNIVQHGIYSRTEKTSKTTQKNQTTQTTLLNKLQANSISTSTYNTNTTFNTQIQYVKS